MICKQWWMNQLDWIGCWRCRKGFRISLCRHLLRYCINWNILRSCIIQRLNQFVMPRSSRGVSRFLRNQSNRFGLSVGFNPGEVWTVCFPHHWAMSHAYRDFSFELWLSHMRHLNLLATSSNAAQGQTPQDSLRGITLQHWMLDKTRHSKTTRLKTSFLRPPHCKQKRRYGFIKQDNGEDQRCVRSSMFMLQIYSN